MKFATGRILLVCLLLSNLAIGTAGYLALRAADARYSGLISGTVPTLNAVRALAWQISQVQRAINRFGSDDGIADDQRLANQSAGLRAARELLDQVRTGLAASEPELGSAGLETCEDGYIRAVAGWRELLARGQAGAARDHVVRVVRPAHDACQERLESLATRLATDGLERSNSLSGTTGFWGWVLMAIAAWPFWVAVGGAVLAAVYVVAMALLWNRLQGR